MTLCKDTLMVDVTRMPEGSFGSVPTPAIVAPIEFTMSLEDYASLGGYTENVCPIQEVVQDERALLTAWHQDNPWPWTVRGAEEGS